MGGILTEVPCHNQYVWQPKRALAGRQKEQILDFIFVAVVLFVLVIMGTRTRRLLKRLEKEQPKNPRDLIVVKLTTSGEPVPAPPVKPISPWFKCVKWT
jgi:hypothetical protein